MRGVYFASRSAEVLKAFLLGQDSVRQKKQKV